jgi:hypothetical protein
MVNIGRAMRACEDIKFSAEVLLGMAREHPSVIADSVARENPFYVPAEIAEGSSRISPKLRSRDCLVRTI